MNAQSKITAAPAFTLEQAQAIIDDCELRCSQIKARRNTNWREAYEARNEIRFCALAVMDALNGVDGFGLETHELLQREMEAFGCDSIWWPLTQLHMAGSAAA